jgi:hypothetical protein
MTLRTRLPITQELTIPPAADTLATSPVMSAPALTVPVNVNMTTIGTTIQSTPTASMELPAGFAGRIGVSTAETLGVPVVSAGMGLEPITMGGGNEGQPEGVDQGYWEGTDQGEENTPMVGTINLGTNGLSTRMPNLGDIGSPTITMRSPTTMDTSTDGPIGSLPQLQAIPTATLRSVSEAMSPPPTSNAPITDLNQYKTSVQTQRLIKYALIAGVIGLVVWYFFFRKGASA